MTNGTPVARRSMARRVWQLIAPYWGSSEERGRAWILIGVVVGLALGLVYIQVQLNDWNRQFYESIQNKDEASFWPLLLQFCGFAAVYIVAAVFRIYYTQMLEMRWRTWLTRRLIGSWLDNQAYYRIELQDKGTDNPDQRIAEDLRLFTSNTLGLGLGLLSSTVTLVSFVVILWTISGPLSFALGGVPITIPGYMLWVAIVYSLAGSVLTHLVGRRLIPLSFQQQRLEADFRFGLVRMRENAEGVALYRGEPVERERLNNLFERVRANWWGLMNVTKQLTFFTVGYDQLASVFPVVVAAPRFFSGAITLGVLIQISNSFGQVQGSLSWFVGSYGSLATWKATVDRILTFQDALRREAAFAQSANRLEVVRNGALTGVPGATTTRNASNGTGTMTGSAARAAQAVHASHVDVALPSGRVVLPDTNFEIRSGERVLFTGPTGSGKSTLFRAIAGIWPYGQGQIEVPADAKLLFLPQRPYLPIGSLREVVSYPGGVGAFSDEKLREVLHAVQLDAFADRLDEVQNWSLLMSGGEQQRLAIARAVLDEPEWLFLDEATAAVDEASERALYELLYQRLPNTTIISIAHRTQVAEFHQRGYTITPQHTLVEREVTAV
jgi:vitamin B12/bleomycin/antimicrobial peptide transport system ATP-binding/permease protein